jgi:hypothetical protein
LVFLEAPKAPQLLGGRRARMLEILRLVLDSGRSADHATATPTRIDELLVEGAISVIRARVASRKEGALTQLLDELMDVITYSYIGPPSKVIAPPAMPAQATATTPGQGKSRRSLDMRRTYRTL